MFCLTNICIISFFIDFLIKKGSKSTYFELVFIKCPLFRTFVFFLHKISCFKSDDLHTIAACAWLKIQTNQYKGNQHLWQCRNPEIIVKPLDGFHRCFDLSCSRNLYLIHCAVCMTSSRETLIDQVKLDEHLWSRLFSRTNRVNLNIELIFFLALFNVR